MVLRQFFPLRFVHTALCCFLPLWLQAYRHTHTDIHMIHKRLSLPNTDFPSLAYNIPDFPTVSLDFVVVIDFEELGIFLTLPYTVHHCSTMP